MPWPCDGRVCVGGGGGGRWCGRRRLRRTTLAQDLLSRSAPPWRLRERPFSVGAPRTKSPGAARVPMQRVCAPVASCAGFLRPQRYKLSYRLSYKLSYKLRAALGRQTRGVLWCAGSGERDIDDRCSSRVSPSASTNRHRLPLKLPTFILNSTTKY